ncbi:MAG: hypothetical protein J0H44_17295 [Alphaproteobacteria bacterium]|nr:hypothetical protein [Alphaproteobacteria bacterium]
MKREAKLLVQKASDSLVLSVELFNRPSDRGRVSGTLIQLDHGFEMLLKAAIVSRGGRIRERRARETIGFDACVRKGLSDGSIKFLSHEQALTLQTINGLRDAAQHHLLNISEGQLYLHVQSGLTLFRDLLKKVFGQELSVHMPSRVLPVSTTPPTNLVALFDSEVKEIQKLLKPGRRRRVEAEARLKPLAIFDATLRGEKGQPSASELKRLQREMLSNVEWSKLFTGVAAINLVSSGTGTDLTLRIAKKEGIPIQLVPEGTPDAAVVAVKRVNDFDFYSLGAKGLAVKLGVNVAKTLAIVEHLGLRKKEDCYKEFKIGRSTFKRYSPKAIDSIKEALRTESADVIWEKRKAKNAAEPSVIQ